MSTFNELLVRANTIKNEVQNKANTAFRVGSWMADLLVWLSSQLNSNSNTLTVELTHESASNIIIGSEFTSPVTISKVTIIVDESFNQDASLNIGNSIDIGKYANNEFIDLSKESIYEIISEINETSLQLIATFDSAGATQGNAIIKIEFINN